MVVLAIVVDAMLSSDAISHRFLVVMKCSQHNDELLAVCSVAYAWLMIFGCIGFFRHFFPGKNPRIRYLSDASYWLYIMHLPVIMFVQSMVSTWNMPSLPKFLIVCAATTLPLLLIYELGVRYTFIGTMLNGRRTRTGPAGT